MAKAVNERMPEEMFIQLLAKKANIIKDHIEDNLNNFILSSWLIAHKFQDKEPSHL